MGVNHTTGCASDKIVKTGTSSLNDDLLDNLDHSRLNLNDGDGDGLTSASVNQTLERLQRIKLAKIVGKTCGCRLANDLEKEIDNNFINY